MGSSIKRKISLGTRDATAVIRVLSERNLEHDKNVYVCLLVTKMPFVKLTVIS